MKNALTTLSIMLLSIALSAQPAQFTFGEGYLIQVESLEDSTYLLLGTLEGHIVLRKINAEAELIWEQQYPKTFAGGEDIARRMSLTEDQQILIAGEGLEETVSTPIPQGIVLLVEANGELVWRRVYNEYRQFTDVQPAEDGYTLCGVGSDAAVVLNVDEMGNPLWRHDASVLGHEYYSRLLSSVGGGYVAIGRTTPSGTTPARVFLHKLSSEGLLLWSREVRSDRSDLVNGGASVYYLNPIAAYLDDDQSMWMALNQWGTIGLFHFSADGELLSQQSYGSTIYEEHPYDIRPLPSGGWLIVGGAEIYGNEESSFALEVSESGSEKWRRYYDQDTPNYVLSAVPLAEGGYFMAGLLESPREAWLLKTGTDGNAAPYTIEGMVFFDLNGNCVADPGEPPANSYMLDLLIPTARDQLLSTDEAGRFSVRITEPEASVRLRKPTMQQDWELCEQEQTVTFSPEQPSADVAFALQPADDSCAALQVTLTHPDLRRGDTSAFVLSVFNWGVSSSADQFARVKLPDDLSFVSASEPVLQSGQTLLMDLPSLQGFTGKDIAIEVVLSADAVLGAAHPIEASLSQPDCLPAWDGPEFEVSGSCGGNEVVFQLQNTGGGGAATSTTYTVLADGYEVVKNVDVDLPADDFPTMLTFPADGRTWQLFLAPPPDHPEAEKSTAVVEGCGTGASGLPSIGYAGAFGLDDEASYRSAVIPVNSTGVSNRIVGAFAGFGPDGQVNDLEPIVYTARASNGSPDTVRQATFWLRLGRYHLPRTFELLSPVQGARVTTTQDGAIKVSVEGLNTPVGGSIAIAFRVRPDQDLLPDRGRNSALIVEGRASFDGRPSFSLNAATHTYATTFPSEVDSSTLYTPNVITYGGRGTDTAIKLAVSDEDGSMFFTMKTNSYSDVSYFQSFLFKTTAAGSVLWQVPVEIPDWNIESFNEVLPRSGGGCLVSGTLRSNLGPLDFSFRRLPFLAEYDAQGNKVWQELYSINTVASNVYAAGLLEMPDGALTLYGVSRSAGNQYLYYTRLDTDGQAVWNLEEPNESERFYPQAADVLEDGSFVILSNRITNDPEDQLRIQKRSGDGSLLWETTFSANKDTLSFVAIDIVHTTDGGYLVACFSEFRTESDHFLPILLLQFAEDGSLLKQTREFIFENTRLHIGQLLALPDGDILLGGGLPPVDVFSANMDIMMARLGDDGELKGIATYGSSLDELAEQIALTPNGNAVLLGYNQGVNPENNGDALLVMADVEADIISSSRRIVNTHGVSVFPNPFEDQVNVTFSPKPSRPITWVLSDLQGRRLKSGVTADAVLQLSGAGLSTGVYVLTFPGTKYAGVKLLRKKEGS
jgi:hypothetical protein